MTTEITTKKNAIQALAARLQVTPDVLQKTLRATAFRECKTNEEFVAAVMVANTYKLNPILKEMYVFPSKGGIIPIVSIDGWIKLATSHQRYNGVKLVSNPGKSGKIESVTATFWLKGIENPVEITEYMEECFQPNKEPWKKWPIRMLRHKAYIQGARLAFGFSGIYDPDEAERIAEAQNGDIHPAIEAEPQPTKAEEPPTIELATEKQIANLYKLLNAAKLPKEEVFDFIKDRCANIDQLTVEEFQTILKEVGELIDANAKVKPKKTQQTELITE